MAKCKITNTKVLQMQTSGNPLYLWDVELKCFGVKVTKTGSKTYIVQCRVAGNDRRLRRFTIGKHGVFTSASAREIAKRIISQARLGIDPSKPKHAGVHKFRDTIDLFFRHHVDAKLKPKTAKDYRGVVNLHLLTKLGNKDVAGITTIDISNIHLSMRETPRMANLTLSVMSAFISWCQKNGYCEGDKNPCRNIRRYKEARRKRYLSADELRRLGAALNEADRLNVVNKYALAAIRLLVLTGARRGEILSMKREWIDFDRGVAMLPDSKTGEKTLHLSPGAINVIDGLHQMSGNPFLICGSKPASHLFGIRKHWLKILDIAEIENCRLHDLRHTFASFGVIGGENLQVVGALLGHSQTGTTERYAHLSDDPIKRAGNKISLSIEAAMGVVTK